MKNTSSCKPQGTAPELPDLSSAMRWLRKSAPMTAEWRRRHRYRADLKRLLKVGHYMIDDIGLAYEEALRESGKPFWKA